MDIFLFGLRSVEQVIKGVIERLEVKVGADDVCRVDKGHVQTLTHRLHKA